MAADCVGHGPTYLSYALPKIMSDWPSEKENPEGSR